MPGEGRCVARGLTWEAVGHGRRNCMGRGCSRACVASRGGVGGGGGLASGAELLLYFKSRGCVCLCFY